MTPSKKQHHFLKLFLFICLILTGLLIPIFYKDVGCEFVYGGGNWNPLQSKILFQGFEDNGVDQTKQALVNDGWKSFEAGFSPSEKESEMIYEYELPEGFKAGQLHVLTKRYGDNGYVKVSVSSDQKHWKVLIEDGRDWRLQRSEGEKTEEWVERKHDVGIPGKYLKDKLYIKFSGACQTGNDWVSVDQWGVKVWKKQSLMGMMRDGIQNIRENTWKEGSRGRWINNRLRYRYHNVANEAKVICEDGGEDLRKAVDGSPLTTRPVAIPENHRHRAVMTFDFGKPRAIGKIGIFFWGDLHRATSYHATEYKIEGLCNGEWLTIGEEKDNRDPLVTHYVNPRYQLTQVKVTFTKAFLDHMVQVGEVYLYEREKVSLIKGIGHFLSQYNKSLPASFLYTLLFLAMLFFPGYCIAQAFPERVLDEEDKFAFSFLFSIILYVIVSLIGLVSKASVVYHLILLATIAGFFLFLYKGWGKKIAQLDRTLLIALPLFIFFSTLYQYHRDLMFSLPHIENYLDTLTIPPMPYYGYHADNLFPWRIAKAFLHHLDLASLDMQEFLGDRFAVFRRTPVLPLLTVPFLHVFGESHFIYQKLLTLLSGLFLLPIYIVIKKIFNKLTAELTTYALLVNFFFFFLSLSVEVYYKYFALFPIFSMLLLIEKRGMQNLKTNFLLGFIGGIAFLIHPMIAFVYLISLGIYIVLKFWTFKWIPVSSGVFFCMIIPWLFFLLYYHYRFSVPLTGSSYVSLILDQTHPKTHLFTRLIGIFLPVIKCGGLTSNNLGLLLALSPFIFILFMLAIANFLLRYKTLFLLSFLPSIIIALPNTQFPAILMFGYYLLIPMALAFCFFYIASIGRTFLRRIAISLMLTQYIVFNMVMGKKLGLFFAQQIQLNHLKSGYIVTYFGMLLYFVFIAFLILKYDFLIAIGDKDLNRKSITS